MNIDLRNIPKEFENSVNQIKAEFDINTNSKAVEYAVVNFNRISTLERELNDTRAELLEIKKDVKTFTGVCSRLNKIT